MVEQRKRTTAAGMQLAEESDLSEIAALPVRRYQRAPPPPRRPPRSLHISLSLFILGFFVLYAQRGGKKQKRLFEAGLTDLPEWYAICSKEGNKVYTVPDAGGVGGVQCVVVGGKEVVDTGSLGESLVLRLAD
jgi:hypothetical protein